MTTYLLSATVFDREIWSLKPAEVGSVVPQAVFVTVTSVVAVEAVTVLVAADTVEI